MKKYIISSYRAGNMFQPYNDGEVFTPEQAAHFYLFDEEAEAVAELTRKLKIGLQNGFAGGFSDNLVHYDNEIIEQFRREAAEEGAPEDYSFYTIPGYYENGEIVYTDDELAAGVGSYQADVTTYYVLQIEIPEEPEEEEQDED